MEFWKPKILLVSRPTLQIRQNRYMWDGYKTTAKRSTVSSTTSASTTAHCRRGRWHSSINSAPPNPANFLVRQSDCVKSFLTQSDCLLMRGGVGAALNRLTTFLDF